MEPVQYLKLKIVTLEYQNLRLRLEKTAQEARLAYDNELRKFGLDPTVDYHLIDDTCEAIPVRQSKPPIPENAPIVGDVLDAAEDAETHKEAIEE